MSDALDHANRLLAESRAMLETLDPELWLETSPATDASLDVPESVVDELRATFERLEREIADLRERVTRLENATRT